MKIITLICNLWLIVCSLTVSRNLYGARPLVTDDAGVVEKSNYELEGGYEHCKLVEAFHSFCFSLKRGFTQELDLGIGCAYDVDSQDSSASLGIKWAIWKEKIAFALANELGKSDYFLNGIFSQSIGSSLCHFNLGYNFGEEKISHSLALEYPVKKINLVAELLGDGEGYTDWLIGIRLNWREGLALDIGYNAGLAEEKKVLTAGFHCEF